MRGSEISTKIRNKLNAISVNFCKIDDAQFRTNEKQAGDFRKTHTLAVFWGQSETDLHVLEQNTLKKSVLRHVKVIN